MKIEADLKLDFVDVLIHPRRSTLSSRSEVQLEKTIKFPNSEQEWTGVALIASNMDTVGTFEMCKVLSEHKIITCLSKHYTVDEFPLTLNREYYMVSTGIKESDWEKLLKIVEKLDPKFICVDVANGYMHNVLTFVKRVRTTWPKKVIAVGNVVCKEMVDELIIRGGADIVKVGIGSGSVCTTRLQTGVGVPQLSAVMETADAAHKINGFVISDGGITCPGDVSKAFAGGADFVMLGSMLAGHDESAGDIVTENDKKYKLFYGMSSDTAMNKYHNGVAQYRSPEGKTVKIDYKGPVNSTINNILGGVRSTCTYVGAHNLGDLQKYSTFLRVNRQANTIHNGSEVSL